MPGGPASSGLCQDLPRPGAEFPGIRLVYTLQCIHSEEGCRWSGPLRHLQGHLNTWSFSVVPCLNCCLAKLSLCELSAHLQQDCSK